MNEKEKRFSMKSKRVIAGLVFCSVAVIAVTGVYGFQNYKKKLNKQIAQAEELVKQQQESRQTAAEEIVLPKQEDAQQETKNPAEESKVEDKNIQNTETNSLQVHDLAFTENSLLEWPASGSVLMNYSMDHTVYFKTLDQYRYNPALIISGEEGEPIYASAPGKVTKIEQLAQTGITVTLDMGNGYEAVYGQLKELPVAEGAYLEKGDLIGYLSQPTKYYNLEGVNLYFEILKNGVPEDPMNYMDYQES